MLSSLDMIDFAGTSLSSEDIVDWLRRNLKIRDVCQQLIYRSIIEQAAREHQIDVAPEEIQSAADQMRYEMRLESAAQTMEWLSEQLISPYHWEQGIRDRLLLEKLRHSLFSNDVERIFAQNQLDYERVFIYRIQVPYRPLAQELLYQIEEGELSFYEAAHLYDVDEERRLRCGYDGRLSRWDFPPDIGSAVFGAAPNELLGPFPAGQSYDLLMVGGFLSADLNDETRNAILDRMFQEWLDSEFIHFSYH
jgi:parvulin-like peptidyl-prolyl isomerase